MPVIPMAHPSSAHRRRQDSVYRWLTFAWRLLLLWLLLMPTAFSSNDTPYPSFKISGFGTLGITKGGNSDLGFRRDVSRDGVYDGEWSFEPDSLLGIQANAHLNEKLSAALQVVGKERQDNSLEESIGWAYVRYRATQNFTVRFGRMGIDIFKLSDYRNLGFAYLWARPPVEFYAPLAFEYFEGVDLAFSKVLDSGTFSAKLSLGSAENQFDFTGGSGAFKLKDIIGASLIWETYEWHLRLTSLKLRIDNSLNDILGTKDLVSALETAATLGWSEAAQIATDLTVDDDNIRYHSLGISFDHYPWVIDYELGYVDPDFKLIKPFVGSYLSVGYRLGATTVYTLLSSANQTEPREQVPEIPPEILANPFIPDAQKTNMVLLQQGVQTIYNDSFYDQDSASLGVRWNIRHDIALKLQWSHTWIEPIAASLWKRRRVPEDETEIDTYSVNVDFIF